MPQKPSRKLGGFFMFNFLEKLGKDLCGSNPLDTSKIVKETWRFLKFWF